MEKENLTDEEYRQKYKLKDVCVNDKFQKFCIWCLKHKMQPNVKMNDFNVCFEAVSGDKVYSVDYPVDNFDFYGADNFQQIVIEEIERLMLDG